MKDEVLVSKAESIERCIRRVREIYVGHEREFEEDWMRQDAIILNLQRACEAAIDMANRMIKLRRLGYPKESKQSFAILPGGDHPISIRTKSALKNAVAAPDLGANPLAGGGIYQNSRARIDIVVRL